MDKECGGVRMIPPHFDLINRQLEIVLRGASRESPYIVEVQLQVVEIFIDSFTDESGADSAILISLCELLRHVYSAVIAKNALKWLNKILCSSLAFER